MSAESNGESKRGALQDSGKTSGGGGGRTVALLQQFQSGQITAKAISLDDRRLLVTLLMSDGYSTAEIAQVLKVSDRSVERDKQAIRQGNALPKDPKLLEQMAGRLTSEAELAVQRIRRASREKAIPPAVKVDAEHRCFQIVSELVQRMQGLGYLPIATCRVEADLTHHNAEVPDLESLGAELTRLRALGDGSLPPEFTELEAQYERARLAVRIADVVDQVQDAEIIEGDVNDDDQH